MWPEENSDTRNLKRWTAFPWDKQEKRAKAGMDRGLHPQEPQGSRVPPQFVVPHRQEGREGDCHLEK